MVLVFEPVRGRSRATELPCLMNIFKRFSSILNFYSYLYFNVLTYRCNRLRCPLARFFWMQCFNIVGHNGYGINLYGVIMILMKLTCRWTI